MEWVDWFNNRRPFGAVILYAWNSSERQDTDLSISAQLPLTPQGIRCQVSKGRDPHQGRAAYHQRHVFQGETRHVN